MRSFPHIHRHHRGMVYKRGGSGNGRGCLVFLSVVALFATFSAFGLPLPAYLIILPIVVMVSAAGTR